MYMSKTFATLTDRVKAGFIDIILIFTLIYSVSEILLSFKPPHVEYVRIVSYIVIFCCYEPILVSLFGGTIGHSICKIEVKSESDTDKNVAIHLSFLRYIIKLFLGWLSFISILFSGKSKAIHDYAVGSVVVEENK